jgi:hypothetical protein
MSAQLTIDFAAARAARDAGMSQDFQHAERVDEDWPDRAYSFLIGYAQTHEFFEGWHVTDAARRIGLGSPTTDKSWGSLYVKAQKEGVMVKCGSGRNPHRHNSICERYRSLVFAGSAA